MTCYDCGQDPCNPDCGELMVQLSRAKHDAARTARIRRKAAQLLVQVNDADGVETPQVFLEIAEDPRGWPSRPDTDGPVRWIG